MLDRPDLHGLPLRGAFLTLTNHWSAKLATLSACVLYYDNSLDFSFFCDINTSRSVINLCAETPSVAPNVDLPSVPVYFPLWDVEHLGSPSPVNSTDGNTLAPFLTQ